MSRPLRLFRLFAFGGLFSIAIASLFLGVLFQHMATTRILEISEQDNVERTRLMVNHFWNEIEPLIKQLEDVAGNDIQQHPAVSSMDHVVTVHLEEHFSDSFRFVKIKIFNRDRLTVYSSTPGEVGQRKDHSGGMAASLGGKVFSSLSFKEELLSFGKVFRNVHVIETYVPVRRGGSEAPIDAVFELYFDISALAEGVKRMATVITWATVAMLLALLLVLLLVVRRAEHLIAKSQQATQEQFTLLATLVETIPAPVYRLSQEGRYLMCNTAFTEFVGRPRTEIIDQTVRDILPKKLAASHRKADAALFAEGGIQIHEMDFPHADGTTHRVLCHRAIYRDAAWKAAGLVCAMTDITERSKIMAALEESERRLRLTVDMTLDAVINIDAKGRVTRFNPAAEKMFGYSRETALGSNIADLLVPSEMREKHSKGFSHFLATGKGPLIGQLVEVEAMRADGSRIPVELLLSAIEGNSKDICTAFIRDVSLRKEAEQNLRQVQKMESIGNLAGGVAHEINNMLLPILSLTKMVEQGLSEGSRDKKRLGMALEAAERVKGLVGDILSFSRREKVVKEDVAAHEVVRQALPLLHSTLPTTITITEDIDDKTGIIHADRRQLQTVLLNLASNAADAMAGRTGTLAVSLAPVDVGINLEEAVPGLHMGPYARITMTDNGCGMDEETKRRIFDPFFTTKGVGEGTGLGLSMVFGIIAQHGGAVAVDSRLGEGSTFTLYLPLVTSPNTKEPKS